MRTDNKPRDHQRSHGRTRGAVAVEESEVSNSGPDDDSLDESEEDSDTLSDR